jgi:hypothetical protein
VGSIKVSHPPGQRITWHDIGLNLRQLFTKDRAVVASCLLTVKRQTLALTVHIASYIKVVVFLDDSHARDWFGALLESRYVKNKKIKNIVTYTR